MAKKKKNTKKSPPPNQPALELVLATVCDSVARDPISGKPTLYGIFERMFAEKFPTKLGLFHYYARLRGLGTYDILLELMLPDGQKETVLESSLDCRENGVAQIHAIIGNIESKKPGIVNLQLKSGRKRVGKPTQFELVRIPKKRK